MALTADQLLLLQALLGVDDTEAVFTDAELELYFTTASDSLYGAAAIGLQTLLVSAAKRNSYSVGQTKEEMKEVFDNLLKLVSSYNKLASAGVVPTSARVVGLRAVPPSDYVLPHGEVDMRWRDEFGRRYYPFRYSGWRR